jgi:hypothetical protein
VFIIIGSLSGYTDFNSLFRLKWCREVANRKNARSYVYACAIARPTQSIEYVLVQYLPHLVLTPDKAVQLLQ